MRQETNIVSEDESLKTKSVIEAGSSGSSSTVETTLSVAKGSDADAAVVSQESIEKAIEQMALVKTDDIVNTEKVIEVAVEGSTGANVTISSESLKAIRDSGADVRIAGNQGSITVPATVSENLGNQGSSVSMSVKKADVKNMTSVQANIVQGKEVFDLDASVDGEAVHELGGYVSVTVPYTPKAGEDLDHITVYYVDDNGGLHSRTTKYDPATHTVTFGTDHFSYYMIAEAGLDTEVEDGSSDDTMLYVGIAAVVAVALVAVAVVVRKRL
jgi:hypothetical protein